MDSRCRAGACIAPVVFLWLIAGANAQPRPSAPPQASAADTYEELIRSFTTERVLVIPRSAFDAAVAARRPGGTSQIRDAARKAAVEIGARSNSRRATRIRVQRPDETTAFSGDIFIVVPDANVPPAGALGSVEMSDYFVAAVRLEGVATWVGYADAILSALSGASDGPPCCGTSPNQPGGSCLGGGECCRGSLGGCVGPNNPVFKHAQRLLLESLGGAGAIATFVPPLEGGFCPAPPGLGPRFSSPLGSFGICQTCTQVQCPSQPPDPVPQIDHPQYQQVCVGTLPRQCSEFTGAPDEVPAACGGSCKECLAEKTATCSGPSGNTNVPCRANFCQFVSDPDGAACGNLNSSPEVAAFLAGLSAMTCSPGTGPVPAPSNGYACSCGKCCTSMGGSRVCTTCGPSGCSPMSPWVDDEDEAEEEDPPPPPPPDPKPCEPPSCVKMDLPGAVITSDSAPPPGESAPPKEDAKPGDPQPKDPKDPPPPARPEPLPDIVDKPGPHPYAHINSSNTPGEQANQSKPMNKAGDPVDIGTGALELDEADLHLPGPVRPLEFRRYYNSRSDDRSTLGSNWTHTYDVRLERVTRENAPTWVPDYCTAPPRNANDEVIPIYAQVPFVACLVLREPGRSAYFYFDPATKLYLPQAGATETARVLGKSGGWALRAPDGRVRVFDALGYLTADRDRFGNGFTVEYEEAPLYRLYTRYCDASVHVPYAEMNAQDGRRSACNALAHMLGDLSNSARFTMDPRLPDDADATPAIREARVYFEWLLHKGAFGVTAHGDRKRRPVRARDDLGRELRFEYYWPDQVSTASSFNATPAAGLLRRVRAPEGLLVEYQYAAPAGQSAFMNERFLVSVQRRDGAPTSAALVAAPPRRLRYEYQWPESIATSYGPFAENVRARYAAFFASSSGCGACGGATSCMAIPPIQLEGGGDEACWLTTLRTREYQSSIADNIISIQFSTQVRLESRYEPDPDKVDTFDRVVAQRFGGASVAAAAPDGYGPWKTKLPLHQLDYRFAAPGANDGDATDTFLPEEIRNRYPLESGHQPLKAPPPCGERGSGCVGSDPTPPPPPPTCPVEDAPPRVSAFPLGKLTTAGRCCRPDLAEGYRAALPGHRPELAYYARKPEPARERQILRSRLNCGQIATRYVGDATHNDSVSRATAVGAALKVTNGRRAEAAADARRLCQWVRDVDADGIETFSGLNYQGRVVVRARHLDQPQPGQHQFLYEETLYNADGQRIEKRRPTTGPAPWNSAAGYTAYFYDEIDPEGESGWNEWLPAYWTRRQNLIGVVDVPQGGTFDFDDDGLGRRQALARVRRLRYEPLFNQLQRTTTGIVPASDLRLPLTYPVRLPANATTELVLQHEFDYQELSLRDLGALLTSLRRWGFGWLTRDTPPGADFEFKSAEIQRWQLPLDFHGDTQNGNSDRNRDGYQGFTRTAADPRNRGRGVAIRSQFGRPGDWRFTRRSFAPHGLPSLIQEQDGLTTSFDFHRNTTAGDTAPADPRPGYRGFPGRVARYRFGGPVPRPPNVAAPCARLRGPYQWLLPETCVQVDAELAALGLPVEVVAAVVASVAPNDDTLTGAEITELAFTPTGALRRSASDGRALLFTHDTDGRVRQSVDPLGVVRSYSYDVFGNQRQVSTVDARGARAGLERFEHDMADRQITHCFALDVQGCLWNSVATANQYSLVETTRYTPAGRVEARRSTSGIETAMSSNARGLLASERDKAAGMTDRQRRFTYTADDDIALIMYGTDETRSAALPLDERFEYDALGQLAVTVDARGLARRLARTSLGEVSRARAGNPDFSIMTGAPPLWEEMLQYNAQRELIRTTAQGQQETALTRSAGGAVIARKSTGAPAEHMTSDHVGRPAWMRDADGQQHVWTWNPQTRVQTTSVIRRLPTGASLTTSQREQLDANLRVTETRTIGHGGETANTAFTLRPADGFATEIVDPGGYRTTIAGNWAGWPLRVRQQHRGRPGSTSLADFELTRFSYQNDQHLLEVLDEQGRSTRVRYNAFGDVVEEQLPGIGARSFTYDGYGRLWAQSTPHGGRLAYRYDGRGDLVKILVPPPPHTGFPELLVVEKRYDELGRVIHGQTNHPQFETAGAGKVVRDVLFDPLGRGQSESFAVGANRLLAVDSAWRPAGTPGEPLRAERLRRTVSLGTQRVHVEDHEATRLIGIQAQRSEIRFEWAGDLYAGRTQSTDGMNLRETAVFDSFGRRSGWSYGRETGAQRTASLVDVQVHRNGLGQVLSRALRWAGAGASERTDVRRWQGYAFDPARRLATSYAGAGVQAPDVASLSQHAVNDAAIAQLAETAGAESIAIDRNAIGSALRARAGGGREAWSGVRTPQSVLEAVRTPAGSSRLRRDGGGKVVAAFGLELEYDPLERLAIVRRNGQLLEGYAYTDDGRLAAVVRPDGVERFAYDGPRMLASRNAADAGWTATWGPGVNRLVAFSDEGARERAVLTDHRKSVVGETQGGALVARTDYATDGAVQRLAPDGSIVCAETMQEICAGPTPFGFSGAWRSDRTGLVLMGQRWYSPQLREFLTPDPLGIADALDVFAYARFDPINQWDPSGLECADLADVSDQPRKKGDLTDQAGPKGPIKDEWGRFGEAIEVVLDKRYVKGVKGNKTGSINNQGKFRCEQGKEGGLACVGFMNYVLAMFLEGTYKAQTEKKEGMQLDAKAMLEDRGIEKMNGETPLDVVSTDTLDKSHVYAIQSVYGSDTWKGGTLNKKGAQSHFWFAVYSGAKGAWVRVEASSQKMKTGVFEWIQTDGGRDFNVYDLGSMHEPRSSRDRPR